MKSADLSIVMPNYNHAHYLPRALDAILRQSVLPKEVIVVDDASADDSVHVVERFAARSPIIRLVRNERNLGVNGAIERGVALCTGRYLYSAAADDYILPGFIQKTMELLGRHPDAGLACTYCAPIDGTTGAVYPYPQGLNDAPCFVPPAEVANLIGCGCFPSRATIYKRASFDRAGSFLTDVRWLSDWFTTLVVAFREGVCLVPERLALWTSLPTTYSARGIGDEVAQRAVMGAMLAHLTSPAYEDVAPLFRETGVLTAWGPEVWRAAAARPDRWEAPLLGLISRFSPHQYEALLEDRDPEVRALASFFLGPLGRLAEGRRERLEAQLGEASRLVAGMKTSKFWKVREACVRLKRSLAAWTGRRRAS